MTDTYIKIIRATSDDLVYNRKRGKEISRRRQTMGCRKRSTKIAPTDFVHATNIRKKGAEKGWRERSIERRVPWRSERMSRTLFSSNVFQELPES